MKMATNNNSSSNNNENEDGIGGTTVDGGNLHHNDEGGELLHPEDVEEDEVNTASENVDAKKANDASLSSFRGLKRTSEELKAKEKERRRVRAIRKSATKSNQTQVVGATHVSPSGTASPVSSSAKTNNGKEEKLQATEERAGNHASNGTSVLTSGPTRSEKDIAAKRRIRQLRASANSQTNIIAGSSSHSSVGDSNIHSQSKHSTGSSIKSGLSRGLARTAEELQSKQVARERRRSSGTAAILVTDETCRRSIATMSSDGLRSFNEVTTSEDDGYSLEMSNDMHASEDAADDHEDQVSEDPQAELASSNDDCRQNHDVESGSRLFEPETEPSTPRSSQQFPSSQMINNDALVEALPVSDADGLAEAEPVDHEAIEQKRMELEEHRKRIRNLFMFAAVVLIGLAIVLGVVLGGGEASVPAIPPTLAPTFSSAPSSMPSNAPTNNLDLFRASLPDYSQISLENPDSAQSRAWEWLAGHPEFSSMEDWRRKQLFALVSFYHSFGGSAWGDNLNWLEKMSPECDWFSSAYVCTTEGGGFFQLSDIDTDTTDGTGTGVFGSSEQMFCIFNNRIIQGITSDYSLGSESLICGERDEYINLFLREIMRLGGQQSLISPRLPPEIELMTFLKALALPSNGINAPLSDLIIPELVDLPNLYLIDMHGQVNGKARESDQDIYGTIPTIIGRATNLSYLDLSGNGRLAGSLPTEIGQMKNLELLQVDHTSISNQIPTHIGLLSSSLRFLSLENTDLTGDLPTEIFQLTKLVYLSVPVSIVLPFDLRGRLPMLRKIYIGGGSLGNSTHFPLALLNQPDLDRIEMPGEGLIGSLPSEIGTFGNLEHLDLSMNYLTGPIPSELGLLTKLTGLLLHQNYFTGAMPTQLGQLSRLFILNLQENLLSLNIPTELGFFEPYRALQPNGFGQLTPVSVLEPPLFALQLQGNFLTGAIVTEIAVFSNLIALRLENNALTGSIHSDVGRLTSLVTFQVQNNNLNGTLPSELGLLRGETNIPHVRLNFANNSLTGTVPDELASSAAQNILVEFNVTGTMIEGELSEELCLLQESKCFWKDEINNYFACHLHFDCNDILCGCNCPCISTNQTEMTTAAPEEVNDDNTTSSVLGNLLGSLFSSEGPIP